MKKINLGIISPSLNAYSETFIQAHKKYIDANVFFYYGTYGLEKLEGKGLLNNLFKKILLRGFGLFFNYEMYDVTFALKKSFKKNKIDFVLIEYCTTAVLYYRILEKLKIPFIVHFHGYDATQTEIINKYGEEYKKVFKSAYKIIVVSQLMKQKIKDLGCPDDKIILNHYGPDSKFLKLELSLNNLCFVSVGRFVNKKAPYYNLLSFKIVLEKFPEAIFHMVGDGLLLEACINISKHLKIDKNVIFHGVKNRDQIISLFKESRSYVQHSVTSLNGDMEGTPLGVLEAAAAGLPVLSTFHAGIPDVIINQETGLLVEEHDVVGMANNMIRILSDLEYAIKLGKTSKKRIENNFSLEKHIDCINSIIYSL